MAGFYESSTINFGSLTLTNEGNYNIFLVKYDAKGNVIWAKSAGGKKYDEATSIAVDASGNIYIAGRFDSPTIKFQTGSGSYQR